MRKPGSAEVLMVMIMRFTDFLLTAPIRMVWVSLDLRIREPFSVYTLRRCKLPADHTPAHWLDLKEGVQLFILIQMVSFKVLIPIPEDLLDIKEEVRFGIALQL